MERTDIISFDLLAVVTATARSMDLRIDTGDDTASSRLDHAIAIARPDSLPS